LCLSACAGTPGKVFTSDTPTQTEYVSARVVSNPVQCVPYAREKSGIQIMGDAHTWWDRAAPKYDRGHTPRPGAVLVLAKTGKMKHGHVAVVKDVLGPRHINVTHSNWGNDKYSRRVIYDSMRVEDISPRNDWSSVKFWNPDKNVFGFPYAARGFIYPSPYANAKNDLIY
jgi:surface antigen